MKLDATPWARDGLSPEDRAEIYDAEPSGARALLSRDKPGGLFKATITGAVSMTVQQGNGTTAIAAFRAALAKVPA